MGSPAAQNFLQAVEGGLLVKVAKKVWGLRVAGMKFRVCEWGLGSRSRGLRLRVTWGEVGVVPL